MRCTTFGKPLVFLKVQEDQPMLGCKIDLNQSVPSRYNLFFWCDPNISCVLCSVCTLLLTFAKAMILRWVRVDMPSERVQMRLLHVSDTDNDEDAGDTDVAKNVTDIYPL